jgi:hypothetical protein
LGIAIIAVTFAVFMARFLFRNPDTPSSCKYKINRHELPKVQDKIPDRLILNTAAIA